MPVGASVGVAVALGVGVMDSKGVAKATGDGVGRINPASLDDGDVPTVGGWPGAGVETSVSPSGVPSLGPTEPLPWSIPLAVSANVIGVGSVKLP